jgi:hypothetical protein
MWGTPVLGVPAAGHVRSRFGGGAHISSVSAPGIHRSGSRESVVDRSAMFVAVSDVVVPPSFLSHSPSPNPVSSPIQVTEDVQDEGRV